MDSGIEDSETGSLDELDDGPGGTGCSFCFTLIPNSSNSNALVVEIVIVDKPSSKYPAILMV